MKVPLMRRNWDTISQMHLADEIRGTNVPGEGKALQVEQSKDDGNKLPNASWTGKAQLLTDEIKAEIESHSWGLIFYLVQSEVLSSANAIEYELSPSYAFGMGRM